ncbi:MAG: hypothetical protein M3383_02495 [Actinomycetota bacterium]|nr:hypothetical protein [Actinomycetota bacterium]
MVSLWSNRLTSSATVLALSTAALAFSACGGDGAASSGTVPDAAPEASAFPDAAGTIQELIDEVGPTNQIVALPSGGTFTPGDERFGFALLDVGGEQILDADVAIYGARGASGKAVGPFPARLEDLTTEPEFVAQTTAPDDAKGVYVSEFPFDQPGEWRLAAVVKQSDTLVATPLATSIIVAENDRIPAVGEQAPAIHTPTLAEVGGDIESIDTRLPPSSMHEDDLADVLGKEPVVLLFATPALCQSRVCGPVVDAAEQLKATHGDEAAFIHMEIYKDNELDPTNLRPQVNDYGLRSEPWLFVIDENGEIATRIEGAFSVNELKDALESLLD